MSEISQTKKDSYHMVSFKCGINKKSTKEQTEQTKNRLIEKKAREMIASGDGDGGCVKT